MTRTIALSVLLLLGACSPEPEAGVPGDTEDTQPFDGIAGNEMVHFVGTEPFWSGTVEAASMTYITPENGDGVTGQIERFAGRGGLSVSGLIDSESIDMTVTPGNCSDGMSDRTFPFTVTLLIGEETRMGCAWTDAQPYSDGGQG